MDMIEKMYMTYGIGSKDEYEQIVRAHQKRQEDMKCDTRKAIVIRRANKPEDEMRFWSKNKKQLVLFGEDRE